MLFAIKDFLEAIHDLQLLDVNDASKFNSLEPWSNEALRQIKNIEKVGDKFEEWVDKVKFLNLEAYSAGVPDSILWNDEDVGDMKVVEVHQMEKRTLEYCCREQNVGRPIRVSSSYMAHLESKVQCIDFFIKSICKMSEDVEEGGEEGGNVFKAS